MYTALKAPSRYHRLVCSFDHRADRTEEYVKAMLALWTMDKPEFRGRYFSFGRVNTAPRPAQKPHPRIVFGGHSQIAMGQATRLSQG